MNIWNKSSKSIIQVGKIFVDSAAVFSLSCDCRPALCSKSDCCCRHYEVDMNKAEFNRAVELLPAASEFASHLKVDGGYENVFDDDGPSWVIDSGEDGYCSFAYLTDRDEPLCSLHSAAVSMGLDPYKSKPACCSFWPLALTTGRYRELTIHDNIFAFDCVTPNKTNRLDSGIASIIETMLGEDFLKELLARYP